MPSLVLRSLSSLYARIVARRNRRFDNGSGVLSADIPVISIGNISTGGTGKSPLVMEVVRLLIDLHRMPAVVSRGYGRSSRGVLVVSDASSVLAGVAAAGDELSMIARSLPNCVVVASEQRFLGIQRAKRLYNIDVAVIDDGFQHRQCARVCDIVIVDRSTLEHPSLIPVGVLREPLSSLSRASLVCITGNVEEHEVRSYTSAPVVRLHTAVDQWLRYDQHGAKNTSAPREVLLVCAIAHPGRVRETCEESMVRVVGEHCFRDHHVYSERDVREIIQHAHKQGCRTIVTTEKDIVKLESFLAMFEADDVDVYVPRIRSECDKPEVLRSVIVSSLQAFDTSSHHYQQ